MSMGSIDSSASPGVIRFTDTMVSPPHPSKRKVRDSEEENHLNKRGCTRDPDSTSFSCSIEQSISGFASKRRREAESDPIADENQVKRQKVSNQVLSVNLSESLIQIWGEVWFRRFEWKDEEWAPNVDLQDSLSQKSMTNLFKRSFEFKSNSWETVNAYLVDVQLLFLLLFDWSGLKIWRKPWKEKGFTIIQFLHSMAVQSEMRMAAFCLDLYQCHNQFMQRCRRFGGMRCSCFKLPPGQANGSYAGFSLTQGEYLLPEAITKTIPYPLSHLLRILASFKKFAWLRFFSEIRQLRVHATDQNLSGMSLSLFHSVSPTSHIYQQIQSYLFQPSTFLLVSPLKVRKPLFHSATSIIQLSSFLCCLSFIANPSFHKPSPPAMFDLSLLRRYGNSNAIERAILNVNDLNHESPTPPIKVAGPVDISVAAFAKFMKPRWSLRGDADFIKIPKKKNVFTVEFADPEDTKDPEPFSITLTAGSFGVRFLHERANVEFLHIPTLENPNPSMDGLDFPDMADDGHQIPPLRVNNRGVIPVGSQGHVTQENQSNQNARENHTQNHMTRFHRQVVTALRAYSPPHHIRTASSPAPLVLLPRAASFKANAHAGNGFTSCRFGMGSPSAHTSEGESSSLANDHHQAGTAEKQPRPQA